MHINSVNQVIPIHNPSGEVIHELVGKLAEHGGASLHSLAHVTIPPGKSSDAHYHRHCEETYYILKGEAHMVIDGQDISLTPGQTCLILPGEMHQVFNHAEEDLAFLVVCSPPWTPSDSVPPEDKISSEETK
jgi:mannose-6-phosphate isomerase-like protein (cupin superfamily)